MYDVQLGAGAIGHIDGGGCGKLCIVRAVDVASRIFVGKMLTSTSFPTCLLLQHYALS
jgi:hypothetical protein